MFRKQMYDILKTEYLQKRSKEALYNLCKYLDLTGYEMPKPIYVYSDEDIRTWKYLIDGKLNPNFAYKS